MSLPRQRRTSECVPRTAPHPRMRRRGQFLPRTLLPRTMISRFTSRKGLCAGLMVTAASTFTLGCFVYHTQGPGPSQASLSSSILQQHALRRRRRLNPVFARLAKAMPAGAAVETGQPTPRRRRLAKDSSSCCWPAWLTYKHWWPEEEEEEPDLSYYYPHLRRQTYGHDHARNKPRLHKDPTIPRTMPASDSLENVPGYLKNRSWDHSVWSIEDRCKKCKGRGDIGVLRKVGTCKDCKGTGRDRHAPKRKGVYWSKKSKRYVKRGLNLW